MSALQDEIAAAFEKPYSQLLTEVRRLTQLVEGLAKSEQPEWVTPKEAASILKVSERTIRTRIKDGHFDMRRNGSRVLIRYTSLIQSQR